MFVEGTCNDFFFPSGPSNAFLADATIGASNRNALTEELWTRLGRLNTCPNCFLHAPTVVAFYAVAFGVVHRLGMTSLAWNRCLKITRHPNRYYATTVSQVRPPDTFFYSETTSSYLITETPLTPIARWMVVLFSARLTGAVSDS